MPAYDPIQTSFAGGEISPRVAGRVDADLYKRALARCANFIPTAQGSIISRGMMERKLANPAGTGSRLIDFRSADGQSYTLILGNLTMRIVTAAGLITSGATELILNGDFDDTSVWLLDGATISGGKLRLGAYSEYVPPLTWFNESAEQGGTASAGDYVFGIRVLDADATHGVHVLLTCGAFTFEHTYYVPGYFTQAVTLPAAAFGLTIDYSSSDHFGSVEVDDVTLHQAGSDFVITTPWTLAQIAALQWVSEQGSVDRLIFVHPNVAPRQLTRSAAGVFALSTITFTSPPASWTGTNWPSVCEIFQGRLYLAGTPDGRNSLWASKPGSLYDFAVGTSQPGDAIAQLVATKGAIRWAQGHKVLLLGTEAGGYVVTGSQGLVLPADIQITQQSGYPCASVRSIFAAGQALYVSQDQRRIRAAVFDQQTDAWESADFLLAAEHLGTPGIREIHFAPEPYELVVALLLDGALACCTFSKTAGMAAWWRFSTDGIIESVSLSSGPEGAVLWASVRRRVEVSIERLAFDPDHDFVLDAALRVPAPVGTTLSGLAHLEGETVRLIVDGALQADRVVASGAITLDDVAVTEVVVGLALPELQAKTLRPEGGNPRGSSQGSRQRRARVALRLNDSALPTINGKLAAPDRTPSTPMDTAEPRMTGDVSVANLGWDENGQVTIEQPLPFRTEILAIFGTTQVNEV